MLSLFAMDAFFTRLFISFLFGEKGDEPLFGLFLGAKKLLEDWLKNIIEQIGLMFRRRHRFQIHLHFVVDQHRRVVVLFGFDRLGRERLESWIRIFRSLNVIGRHIVDIFVHRLEREREKNDSRSTPSPSHAERKSRLPHRRRPPHPSARPHHSWASARELLHLHSPDWTCSTTTTISGRTTTSDAFYFVDVCTYDRRDNEDRHKSDRPTSIDLVLRAAHALSCRKTSSSSLVHGFDSNPDWSPTVSDVRRSRDRSLVCEHFRWLWRYVRLWEDPRERASLQDPRSRLVDESGEPAWEKLARRWPSSWSLIHWQGDPCRRRRLSSKRTTLILSARHSRARFTRKKEWADASSSTLLLL